jgi:hypothetical protein
MKHKIISILCAVFVVFAPVAKGNHVTGSAEFEGARFIRVELYFGFDRKGQTPVSESEWSRFLDDEVTPRFPDGFTVFSALGQYRTGDGSIVREESRVLVVLYPKSVKKKNGALIEEIRAGYKKRFQQESVMRLEFVKSVDVEF